MGRVTILKRGEALSSKPPQSTAVDFRSDGDESSVLCSTNRLGPDPGILPKLSDLSAIYAGPAYISSPAPSSLPFPAFFLKRTADEASKSEIATKGLRCLLRLDDIA
ncbi:uncharacterized protein A4U43_C08F8020 [Asparagus officinalis]|nr:uncharacterized protein A4U43_C08F8020 [Asparagus officinalis]